MTLTQYCCLSVFDLSVCHRGLLNEQNIVEIYTMGNSEITGGTGDAGFVIKSGKAGCVSHVY